MILNPYLGKYRTISFPVYYGPSYPSADIGWCSIGDFWNDDEKYTGPVSVVRSRWWWVYFRAQADIEFSRRDNARLARMDYYLSASVPEWHGHGPAAASDVRGHDDDGCIKTFSYWGCWGLAWSTTTTSNVLSTCLPHKQPQLLKSNLQPPQLGSCHNHNNVYQCSPFFWMVISTFYSVHFFKFRQLYEVVLSGMFGIIKRFWHDDYHFHPLAKKTNKLGNLAKIVQSACSWLCAQRILR